MRVFVAGASGALGRPLVRALVDRGHQVVGLTRSPSRRDAIEKLGARAVIADALDAVGLLSAVQAAEPTHVVHLLTALPPGGPLRERDLRGTNEVRTAGTRNLLRAASAAGARRLVAESFVGVYGPATRGFGEPVRMLDEFDALPDPAGPLRATVQALRDMERQLREAAVNRSIETVVLRYGGFYGPGVPSTDSAVRQMRAGRLFAPPGEGVLSFIHVDDAVTATIAALEHPTPGPVYNVCDDQPMSIEAFMRVAAEAFGARPPRRLPRWLVRLAAPVPAVLVSWGIAMSNARAAAELGWRPRYRTAADGLRHTAAAMSRLEAAA